MKLFRARATLIGACLVVAVAASSAAQSPSSPSAAESVTLITHDSFALSDAVLASFQAQTGTALQVLRAGDAGSMVNQAILTRDNPLADVLFGVDNTFLSRALDAGIFEPYEAAGLDQVPEALRLDPERRVTPIDYGDVCLNLDLEAFAEGGLPRPERLEDLLRPELRGRTVVENPATSSPGLAFMLATIARFGEQGEYTWRTYWSDLRANDVLVTAGWEDAYYGRFSGGSGEGDRPIVVSYASSPVAEVVYASPPPTTAPTAVMLDGCFRQIEFAGVLAGARAPGAARAVVDFLLSPAVQEDIPLTMFVYPASSAAQLPEAFTQFTQVPAEPGTLDPALIGANRDRWIEEWTDTVLR
jgi:thiamine transport system substrate-binding protein